MNENNSKVSIIIPVHNTETYLKQCLDSVTNQTLKDIEIILIDDGSTDNSGKICEEYASKDNRIKVIHQKNQGQGKARNEGLKIAKGEYIGFVDSDDWIALDFYEKLYEKAKSSDYEVAVAKIVDFYEKDNQYITLLESDKISINFKDVVWDSLYKKCFLDKNNICFPENKIFEDVLFSLMINCFVKKRFFYVDTIYYRRRNRKNSIMYNFREKFNAKSRFEILDLCEKFLYSIKNSDLYSKTEKIFYQRKINYLFEVLENDKSFFKYIKNEIKNINFSDNEYILADLKEKCEKLLNSKNYKEFNNYMGNNKKNEFFVNIKTKIVYLIYIILLKLGIKDTIKNLLIKLGFKF